MIGQQIQNYKITHELGSGGMATVYEAVHVRLKTKVAVKVLNPVLASNEGIRKRFEQEAQIMASLNHEGITKVIDFDDKDNHLAIVMEFMDGQTLDEYINKKGALEEEEAMTIFLPILNAFAYAHSKGIVHRDVKPSNIFITSDGKVKIMDFGIAKIVEEGAKALTQTGTLMGTPVYMSPEQINDSKHIDQRSDIYSLGVTLWFMLNGKPPYDTSQDSSFQIFKKIDNVPLPELIEYPVLDIVIQKATAKKCNDRIKRCEEFIAVFSKSDYTLNVGIGGNTQLIDETKELTPKTNITQSNDIIASNENHIIANKIRKDDQNKTLNKSKIINNKYLILKLISIVIGIGILEWIFSLQSGLYYTIDGKSVPMIYLSYLLIGLGQWFILRKYLNLLYPTIIIIFAVIPYWFMPEFLGTFFLYTIIETGLQYFSLRKKEGYLVKWILYVTVLRIIMLLIATYLVYPFIINTDETPYIMQKYYTIAYLFRTIIYSIFLGLFFTKVYFKLDKDI